MSLLSLRLFTVLLLTSSLVLSCTRYREADTEDRIEKIEQKIDSGKYDESIQDLNEILRSEPNNDRARTILASVYVHRARINIKDYFELVNVANIEPTASEPLIDVKSLKKLAGDNVSEIKSLTAFLQRINDSAAVADQISKQFEAILLVDQNQAADLQLALNELEKLKQPTDGMIFYRGVIKLYFFKFLWMSHSLLPIGENRLCSMTINEIAKKIKLMNDYFVRMVIDISKGFPNSTKDFVEQAKDIDTRLREAQSFLMTQNNSNQTLKSVMNTQLKELEIGNFKCDF